MLQPRSNSVAFMLGLTATIALLWLLPRLFNVVSNYTIQFDDTAAAWVYSVSRVVRDLLNLLPGFLVGLYCLTRGIIVAFGAGLVGALIYPAFLTVLPNYGAMHDPFSEFRWSTHIGYCVIVAITSAAGAALALALRSNHSMRRQNKDDAN
jgi:hypothetical protein